ncbi:MAG: hypothetical protein IPM54_40650 [Polyangiaceae bacterium]|nr:hypothetical protein [Polyangiaceae bacterium]
MKYTKSTMCRIASAAIAMMFTGVFTTAAGCSSDGSTTTTGSGSGGTVTCGMGQVDCGVCVTLSNDLSHCGACDKACAPGEVCSAGECGLSCVGGTSLCNGICVDTNVDPNNCGTCENACTDGQVCSAGQCGLTCVGGTSLCNGICVDTNVDPSNCGTCGNACTDGQVCSAGQCGLTCVGGTSLCNGICVDTNVDPNNCGTCGNACTDGQVCSAGQCGLTCVGGTSLCNGICVDTNVDPSNCGTCENACTDGQVCSAGQCGLTCVGGTTACNGICVDTDVDPSNCGTCGNACTDGQVCSAGQCTLSCVGGTTLCNGACVDTDVDPNNCGACNTVCGAGTDCVSGQCIPLCSGGNTLCNGACVDTSTDTNNCGTCGNVCPLGNTCFAGACTAPTGYYVLTGTPNPATVFDTIAETYRFPNNLTNSIWHRPSNVILTGEFSTNGYWAFPQATNVYPSSPNNGTQIHARMVSIPATATVVYSNAPSVDGVGPANSSQFSVVSINAATGLLTAGVQAVFSDGFASGCRLTSSSATEFLCYDGTAIRRYGTTAGSATLTYLGSVSLSAPLPTAAQCAPANPCYGSTFAFDGAYYYFAAHQGSSSSLNYIVYTAAGVLVNTFAAAGAGSMNGVYFDWWVGRYSAHDGYGNRSGGSIYGPAGSDTHCFSPISSAHTLF